MSETEELKARIETIRALSGQLRERNRTVKSLEAEMTAATPEHPWSFGKIRRYNLLKAELEDERVSASEDKYRLGSLSKDLFEDFNIVSDKATATNSLESMLDLIEQSLDTDPEYRESVRQQAGITDGTSYMRLVPQDNPEGMLPPTPWGKKAAEEAYRQDQVQQLDPQVKLLRTLATGSFKNHDTPETNDYLALMDFNKGDVSNESEVFLPNVLHCTVMEKTTDGEYLDKKFERIYRLDVESEESPIPKKELLEFPKIQTDVPMPDPAIDQDAASAGLNDPGLEL